MAAVKARHAGMSRFASCIFETSRTFETSELRNWGRRSMPWYLKAFL